jgi:hypothetical protein
MTGYLKEMRAAEGDSLEFSREDGASYTIRLVRKPEYVAQVPDAYGPVRIKITAGWRRVH